MKITPKEYLDPVAKAVADAAWREMARKVDTNTRKKMAGRGTAMPDGSFPIANLSDLRNAVRAVGRAKNIDAAKRHICKRARALGAAAGISFCKSD